MNTAIPQPNAIHAEIPYVAARGEPLVVIEPPEGKGDAQRNFDVDRRTLPVVNARLSTRSPTLDIEGFAMVGHNSSFRDFDNPEKIRRNYYPEAEQVVAQATGASTVLAFDHNIRVDGDHALHRKPAGIVHVDLTEQSARRIVQEQLQVSKCSLDRLVFINTWRPLTDPVFSAHLAFCDASTVPDESLLRAELRYEDRIGELFYCSFHHAHRWQYFPQMTPDELLLLKNYDSTTDGRARFTPHTAIEDASAPANAHARESIEVRTIALFE